MSELHLIRTSVSRRGITRLCHFTPSRNLAHIIGGSQGILAAQHLSDNEARIFNPTDKRRLDGYTDHVCFSVQYPNAWYFSKARLNEPLFRDWVVLLIDARYLWASDTKFCPRNAAAGQGRLVDQGFDAFEAMFADVVEGVRTFRRGQTHPEFLSTDEQAEVLIPDRISIQDVSGVGLQNDEQAANETSRLRLQGLAVPRLLIVPEFFKPTQLSEMLRSGRIPDEREYSRGCASV